MVSGWRHSAGYRGVSRRAWGRPVSAETVAMLPVTSGLVSTVESPLRRYPARPTAPPPRRPSSSTLSSSAYARIGISRCLVVGREGAPVLGEPRQRKRLGFRTDLRSYGVRVDLGGYGGQLHGRSAGGAGGETRDQRQAGGGEGASHGQPGSGGMSDDDGSRYAPIVANVPTNRWLPCGSTERLCRADLPRCSAPRLCRAWRDAGSSGRSVRARPSVPSGHGRISRFAMTRARIHLRTSASRGQAAAVPANPRSRHAARAGRARSRGSRAPARPKIGLIYFGVCSVLRFP